MGESKEKLYEVFTPVKSFSGYRYGVPFKEGKGMATKHQAEVLVGNWGYSCPELEKEKAQNAPEQAIEAEKDKTAQAQTDVQPDPKAEKKNKKNK